MDTEAAAACLIQKHLWLCLKSAFSRGARNGEEALMVFTKAPLQTCPCQPLLHPSPCCLLSLLTARHWVPTVSPLKTRELQALSFAELCTRRQHHQRHYKEGRKNWVCLGLPSPLSHHQQLWAVSSRETCWRARAWRRWVPEEGWQRRAGQLQLLLGRRRGNRARFHPQAQPPPERSGRAQAGEVNCKHECPCALEVRRSCIPQPGVQERPPAFPPHPAQNGKHRRTLLLP